MGSQTRAPSSIRRGLSALLPHLLPLGLWTALWCLFFGTFLLGLQRLPDSDFAGQFHAFALFQAREMTQGRLPLWSPGSYAGTPFAADPQAAVFYPPRWLTVLFSLCGGLSYHLLTLEALVHVWLAGVFAYALAFSITRERPAALLGATAFGLGGYLTSYPILQLAVLETITWLPLALLLVRLAVRKANPLPWLVGVALVLGLSSWAGHPQTLMHACYMVLGYYVFSVIRARWRWGRALGLGALVLTLVLGLAAVVWVPALQLAAFSTRNQVNYHFVSGGLPMLNLVQLLVPGALSVWVPEYVGLPAILLVSLGCWARDRRSLLHGDRRGEWLFWALMAFLATWLALGDAGVLFQLVHYIAPGFSLFRQQERLLGLYSLALSLLAAQGLALWLRMADAERRVLLWRAGATIGGALALCGLVLALVPAALLERGWLSMLGVQALFLLVTVALLWPARGARLRSWLFVPFLAVSLYQGTYGSVNRRSASPAVFWSQPAWLDQIKGEEPLRIDSGNLVYANLGEIYDLEDIRGISPLKPLAMTEFRSLPTERLWQLFNVRYVLAEAAPGKPGLTPVAQVHEAIMPDAPLQATLYRYEQALPRAWVVYRVRVVPGGEDMLKALADPALDLRGEALLSAPVSFPLAAAPPARAPVVRVERLSASTLRIHVDTESPGLLVISEWAYPGWRATLDEEPVPLRRANEVLQALPIPTGSHVVLLRFRPLDVWIGALASLIALVMAALLTWRGRVMVATRPIENSRAGHSGDTAVARRGTIQWPRISPPWLLLLIVLLGMALRSYHLGAQELRGDEAFSYLVASRPLAQIVPLLRSTGEDVPPLHYLSLYAVLHLLGRSEFSMRMISLLPGMLYIPLAYMLGRQVRGPRLGLLLASLGAISASLVWMSQDVRNMYSLTIFFSALGTWALARAVQRSTWSAWVGYALCCDLILYSHYYGVFVCLAQAAAMLAVPVWRKRLLPWFISMLIAAVLFLPWLISAWPTMWSTPEWQVVASRNLASHVTGFGVELVVGSTLHSPLERWIFVVVLIVAALGARELFRRRPAWAVLTVVWLASAGLIGYLFHMRREMFNWFYILPAAPAWWILVGEGLAFLWCGRHWHRVTAALALGIILVANGVSLGQYYWRPGYDRSNGYRPLASYLAEHAQPGDMLVANAPDPCLDYYLEQIPIPRTMEPRYASATAKATQASLAELAGHHDRLWFVPQHHSSWDPQDVAYEWLESNAFAEHEATFQRLTLVAYRFQNTLGQVLLPLDLAAGDRCHLQGVFLKINGHPVEEQGSPPTLGPGDRVEVALLWRSDAHMREGYTVFVHLLDGQGRLVAQHDGWPAEGKRPTWTWTPGEVVLDRHIFDLPDSLPAGSGMLLVGLYNSETQVRLPFADGRDAVPIIAVVFGVRPTASTHPVPWFDRVERMLRLMSPNDRGI